MIQSGRGVHRFGEQADGAGGAGGAPDEGERQEEQADGGAEGGHPPAHHHLRQPEEGRRRPDQGTRQVGREGHLASLQPLELASVAR